MWHYHYVILILYVETDTFLHWTGQLSPGLFVTL